MVDQSNHSQSPQGSDTLRRNLHNRHIQLIAIGGAIERVCLWARVKPLAWPAPRSSSSI